MSIKNRVTILFIISLLLMTTLSLWIKKIDNQKNRSIIVSKYRLAINKIVPLIIESNDRKLNKRVKELNLEKISPIDGEVIFSQNITFGRVEIIFNKEYYLKIDYLDDRYIFTDTTQDQLFADEYFVKILFLIDIIILISIYLAILKILSPINKLSTKLTHFANGDYSTTMQESGAKEIKELSKSFNQMATALKQNIDDRENLLRFFGHEIRTPLAKAQFALQKRDHKLIKRNLKEIEVFVDEVLNMHLITDTNLNRSSFGVDTLIIESLNKTKIEDESNVVVDIDEFDIDGDLYYLSIALKNLIDNAIKYTTKLPIEIVAIDNYIEVHSYGDRLENEFQHYIKPFSKENSDSLGLGLSLVDLILKKHNYKLSYRYNDEKNIFIIDTSIDS